MLTLKPIAHIKSDFPTKFGIPRQSGLVQSLCASVVFCPPYRAAHALRGLADFSHIWLIWGFSKVRPGAFAPTVRPPRLGGNARMGVFATRSPNRPNPLGLSCVRLSKIEWESAQGPVLHVLGADLASGTPIYDIKPYLPYTDCRPEAEGGFADGAPGPVLQVEIAPQWLALLPPHLVQPLREVLALDPRPPYQEDPSRVYGMAFAGFEVRFTVSGARLIVTEIVKEDQT